MLAGGVGIIGGLVNLGLHVGFEFVQILALGQSGDLGRFGGVTASLATPADAGDGRTGCRRGFILGPSRRRALRVPVICWRWWSRATVGCPFGRRSSSRFLQSFPSEREDRLGVKARLSN